MGERGEGVGYESKIVPKFLTLSTKRSNCCCFVVVVVVFVMCRFVSKPAGLSHEKNLLRLLTRKVWWPSTSWNLDLKNKATARRRACDAACQIHAPYFSTRPFIRRRRAVGTSPDHVVHLVSDGESTVPESPAPPPHPHLAKHTPTGYTRLYVYQMLIRIRIPYVYHRLLVFVWFLRVFSTEGWYVFSFSLRLKIFPRKGKRSRDNSRVTRSLLALRSHASRVIGIGRKGERPRRCECWVWICGPLLVEIWQIYW